MTKRAIAEALKKLSGQYPLSKITIRLITGECGINRQTFYYHFRDIYDLMEWIYANEGLNAIGGRKTYDTWQQGYLSIFRYVQANRDFVLRTFHSIRREMLERFLYEQTYQLLLSVVEEKACDVGKTGDDEKQFIANFYKFGFVGLVIDWIEADMRQNPEEIVAALDTLIRGDIEKALGKFCRDPD